MSIMPSSRARAEADLSYPGYLSDVSDERYQVTREVVIMPPIEIFKTEKPEVMFTEKMNREFSKEFRYRFGFTEFEQLEFTSNRFVSGGDNGRLVPVNEFIDKQEDFGRYMIREFTEYHADRYLKGNRKTRVIYKTKEAISNVEVKAAGGYKVKFRYKLSSNRMQLKLEKPSEKFHKQLDTKLDGKETTLRLSYDLSKSLRIGTDYSPFDETLSLYAARRLTASLETSITGQSFHKDIDDTPAQERVLLGLKWND